MCRKNGGFTGFPTVKKSLFKKKRERQSLDERRLKTQKKQKIKRNILVHPSICFLVAHVDELTCRSRPCHPRNHGNRFNGSAEMAILVGGFLTTLHSWRDGDVLVAQFPKSASPSSHLLQFANWKPVRKPWPSSFDDLPFTYFVRCWVSFVRRLLASQLPSFPNGDFPRLGPDRDSSDRVDRLKHTPVQTLPVALWR